jgi:hypothetical protein
MAHGAWRMVQNIFESGCTSGPLKYWEVWMAATAAQNLCPNPLLPYASVNSGHVLVFSAIHKLWPLWLLAQQL